MTVQINHFLITRFEMLSSDDEIINAVNLLQHLECCHFVTTFKMSSHSDEIFFSGINPTYYYVRSDDIQKYCNKVTTFKNVVTLLRHF